MENKSNHNKSINRIVYPVLSVVVAILGVSLLVFFFILPPVKFDRKKPEQKVFATFETDLWKAPDFSKIPNGETGVLIKYGRDLIVQTATYLGPNGSVLQISNGMNCQNCHLDAGTKPFSNNYSAVAKSYPKLRARSGSIENIEKRINDCLERSLNGKALLLDSREMKAMSAYIMWVGSEVPKGEFPKGVGLVNIAFLDRPARAENGKIVYEKCIVCHGKNGEGIMLANGSGWQYPPLWGEGSYNIGAGLYRLSRFAGYVKANMPFGATWDAPQLTDEEAWDVAAYVNSMPRPTKDLSKDWPDISKKPIDHPFGPYADDFDVAQHKFGPFKPIQEKSKTK